MHDFYACWSALPLDTTTGFLLASQFEDRFGAGATINSEDTATSVLVLSSYMPLVAITRKK